MSAPLECRGWHQEAALRMLRNNLHPEVAERPQDLVVYGGTGKAARNWDCYRAIEATLKRLENDETLLVQSGKPVGVLRTHDEAPRVLIANSNLVPRWATWDEFRRLEALGLTMYGQITAGSWIYIGTQGILQGTYETFAACAAKHFGGSLAGRIVVSAGLGGMGGAQPLAATMNGATFLGIEVDPSRVRRRVESGYCDQMLDSLDEALKVLDAAKRENRSISIGLMGNVADVLPELARRGVAIDVLTDQTAAHDLRVGYIPRGNSVESAAAFRERDSSAYENAVLDSMQAHVAAMLEYQQRGTAVFDYGNNLRGQVADHRGMTKAFGIPGFVPEYIRPLFCKGSGPFRWAALSGDAADIAATDDAILETFPHKEPLARWIRLARQKVKFQGLPARICWLEYGERAEMGAKFNWLVRTGRVKAPLVIGRDHLDCGSVASPNRETEGMKDGSDAIADWPLLNALSNTACGASWVSLHHGGGVGIGYSIHAGMVIVADGTESGGRRLQRVLTADPALGVMRHADAGYDEAIATARERGVDVPMASGVGVSAPRITILGALTRPRSPGSFMMPQVLTNIRELATCRCGLPSNDSGLIHNAAFAWDDTGRVLFAGRAVDLPTSLRSVPRRDAKGATVIPGLVDCHTHLAFAGWREEEFALRCQGAEYTEIAARGGGIVRTVRATRAASEAELTSRAGDVLAAMLRLGVTTIECKSGYGLTLTDELRLLRVYRRLRNDFPGTLVSTFLGAHVVPAEFRDDRAGYVRLICDQVIPAVAADNLASFCDVFVEHVAFTADEARQILTVAKAHGLSPKLHVDQLADGGGAALAAEVGATSADHLEFANDDGLRAMATAGVVAVLLPLASLYLHKPPLDARRCFAVGVQVAVATDFNPGSAPSYHLPFALTLACTMNRMTPQQALRGATLVAAKAIGLEHQVGSLEPGKRADFVLLDAESVEHWLYHLRPNAVLATFTKGQCAWHSSDISL